MMRPNPFSIPFDILLPMFDELVLLLLLLFLFVKGMIISLKLLKNFDQVMWKKDRGQEEHIKAHRFINFSPD